MAYTDALADAYTDAVIRAVETQPYGSLRAGTVYLGGGTPVLLGAERLGRILAAIDRSFGSEAGEITLEANPAAVTREELHRLRQLGVNRLSFGVQSLVDGELRALGRLHTAAEARKAILDGLEAGFTNISADLMLATPGQTAESLAYSIRELLRLPVTHVSAYLLKIEEGTPFGDQKSALDLPDEDETADRYLQCVGLLESAGFMQYEISSFARDGLRSWHNMTYWQCGEYLGIGPAAHSFLGGRRFFFPKGSRELAAFLAAERPFVLAVDDGAGGNPEERMMLALRLTDGVDITALSREQAASFRAKAAPFMEYGLARLRGERLSLTPEGFLLSNRITAALLESVADIPGS